MSYLTEDEIEALQSSGLSRDSLYAYSGVMNTQMSIARFYGGIRMNGQNYTYFQATDELIRDDVLQWLIKRRKKIERDSRNAGAKGKADVSQAGAASGDLLG